MTHQYRLCTLIALSLSCLISIGTAQAAKNTKRLPQLLEEVEAKYIKASTMSADFTQKSVTEALGQTKISSGVLMAKRPNKVRWETLQPDKSILVSDGKTFWFYTPPFDEEERGQLIERKSSEVQSRLANALLSGSFSMARDMKISAKGDSAFILKPKSGTAGTVREAQVRINADKIIDQVILFHKGGNKAEIQLTNIKLGQELGDDVFIFTPPPNTDRIQE
jgi:outer membrane lipoprotein carrier protein